MRFQIKDEIRGRIRIHLPMKRLTCRQADLFQYAMETSGLCGSVRAYERTADAVLTYHTKNGGKEREDLLRYVSAFQFESAQVPEEILEHSGREMNLEYREKLIQRVLLHYGRRLFLPMPVRIASTGVRSLRYFKKGLQSLREGRLDVAVLDAAAVTISFLRGDISTAGSVMMLLEVGGILEEWTHKKSVDDLARTMSLHVDKVWLKQGDQEILVPYDKVKEKDQVIVHMGNVIPFDGTILQGEGMVNQASMTGESLPVRKTEGMMVFAGTVMEEGEITIEIKSELGASRYDKIVKMIEETEKLKSNLESQAEHLADRLVPYTFLGTGLVYGLTRDVAKTLSVLMVDFSCALKLAMPIAVLSAIREASRFHITVKGGKFLEAVAEADTIVFDKTGTLTRATPKVYGVEAFGSWDENEALRIAACLEEHFPHSMARAVVAEAARRGLDHEEMHSQVNYIVAHGISTMIEEKKAIIGSYHFVFEDEGCKIPRGGKRKFDHLPDEYSHLYLAVEGKLAAVILIEDPIREEAADVIQALRKMGISQIVMMTGDSERTAASIAARVGVDQYFSEVLPEDKAGFVQKKREEGCKVMMIGDGINDSPALSSADVGIAISDGAEIAREIADITLSGSNLHELVKLREISEKLFARIRTNYHRIVGFNSALIVLGVAGVLQPTTSALLHNASTLAISLSSMTDLTKPGENWEDGLEDEGILAFIGGVTESHEQVLNLVDGILP